MDSIPDWKKLLCKVMHAFGEEEGTHHSNQWYLYDISDEEREVIENAWVEYMETLNG